MKCIYYNTVINNIHHNPNTHVCTFLYEKTAL